MTQLELLKNLTMQISITLSDGWTALNLSYGYYYEEGDDVVLYIVIRSSGNIDNNFKFTHKYVVDEKLTLGFTQPSDYDNLLDRLADVLLECDDIERIAEMYHYYSYISSVIKKLSD